MKKLMLILFILSFGFHGIAQRNNNEGDQGLINGCRDAKAQSSSINWNTYYSIMNNHSISSEYKASYDQGWTKCLQSSGYYTHKKGKVVFVTPKTDYGKGPKPGKPWVYQFLDPPSRPSNME